MGGRMLQETLRSLAVSDNKGSVGVLEFLSIS